MFGDWKGNFWTAFGTRNALVYCCGAEHGEDSSTESTVISPTTADGTPKSCAEAEIVQRSLRKVVSEPTPLLAFTLGVVAAYTQLCVELAGSAGTTLHPFLLPSIQRRRMSRAVLSYALPKVCASFLCQQSIFCEFLRSMSDGAALCAASSIGLTMPSPRMELFFISKTHVVC